MQFSNQVKFLPWVGASYKKQPRKILFLGESHYEADEINDGDATNEVIQRQFGEGQDVAKELERYKFLRGLERLFSGNSTLTKEGSKKFWNEVAFYNFVQFGMISSDTRPTTAQFRKSVDPFCEVACDLKPDVIVVASLKTWDNLPNTDGLKWELVRGELAKSPQPTIKRVLEVWCCTATHENKSHKFWCFFIPHTSAPSFGAIAKWVSWRVEAFKEIDFHSSGAVI